MILLIFFSQFSCYVLVQKACVEVFKSFCLKCMPRNPESLSDCSRQHSEACEQKSDGASEAESVAGSMNPNMDAGLFCFVFFPSDSTV